MKPLEEFKCDFCGELIKLPSQGILEFISVRDASGVKHCSEFKIVHQAGSSPLAGLPGEFCFHHKQKNADLPLLYIVNDPDDVLPRCFSQEYGVSDELKEIANRIKIPFYEEARQNFDKAVKDGIVEKEQLINPSSVLMEVIVNYYRNGK